VSEAVPRVGGEALEVTPERLRRSQLERGFATNHEVRMDSAPALSLLADGENVCAAPDFAPHCRLSCLVEAA
jgi:hypothetical protein